jgi:hypothetical protein
LWDYMADNVWLGKEEEEAQRHKCDNDVNDDNGGYGGGGGGEGGREGGGGGKKGKRIV